MRHRADIKEAAFAADGNPATYLYAAQALRDFGMN